MSNIQDLVLAAEAVRKWRGTEIQRLQKVGCTDLAYRPKTGMSSLGWVLAHQAAVYDYSLNMLIKQGVSKRPDLFKIYTPGTSGSWAGTPLEEIQEYFDECERDLLDWVKSATEKDFERIITDKSAPAFFQGMTVREVLASTFAHLNYHTGHLTALRRDFEHNADVRI
jgi:uncharacterized damage-inducible protein DinB